MNMFMESVGWIGNIVFAISAMPQSYMCWKQGHGRGLSAGLLTLWGTGELLSLTYGVWAEVPAALIMNYVVNFICLVIILRYKFFPVSRSENT